MKKNVKWIILGVILIVAAVWIFMSCGEKGTMEAVSEDGAWEAHAFETTVDGETVWKGVVIYVGENADKMKNVRTQTCVNGIKGDFIKRTLKAAGSEGIEKSDAGGEDQYYLFLKGREEKPNSLSVKVKWEEDGATKIEKMWLIDQ